MFGLSLSCINSNPVDVSDGLKRRQRDGCIFHYADIVAWNGSVGEMWGKRLGVGRGGEGGARLISGDAIAH